MVWFSASILSPPNQKGSSHWAGADGCQGPHEIADSSFCHPELKGSLQRNLVWGAFIWGGGRSPLTKSLPSDLCFNHITYLFPRPQ